MYLCKRKDGILQMVHTTGAIAGIIIKKLEPFSDERGMLMEILRADDDLMLEKFGQVYLTTAYPNVVKAWHWHEKQDDNFCVIKGMAKVALYDRRPDSPTFGNLMELFIGEKYPCVVHIPIGVAHGYKAIGDKPCYLINTITQMYNRINPDEQRIAYNDPSIPYNWNNDING